MSAHAVCLSFPACSSVLGCKCGKVVGLVHWVMNANSSHAQLEPCSVTLSLTPYTFAAAYRSPHMQVGEVGEDWFSIYLIPETLRVTVLGTKQQGDTVNLEIEAQTQV